MEPFTQKVFPLIFHCFTFVLGSLSLDMVFLKRGAQEKNFLLPHFLFQCHASHVIHTEHVFFIAGFLRKRTRPVGF